jgi:hypothetical protein
MIRRTIAEDFWPAASISENPCHLHLKEAPKC